MIDLNNNSREKGITLIALVITIIVLLILAGISITMLTGNNSILTKAGEAKNRTKETSIVENISLAYNSGKIEKYVGTKSLSETIEEELAKIYGEDNVEVNDNGDNTYTVTINSEEYNIEDGKVEKAGPVVNPYDPDGWVVAWVYPTTEGNWSDVIRGKSALPQNYEIIAKLYEVNEGNINYSLVIEGQGEISGVSSLFGNNPVKVIICDGITSIGEDAFMDFTDLKSIKMSSTVTSIGNSVFENCTGLTSVIIPDSITSIGVGAFVGCTGLTNIKISNSLTSIGDYAFGLCSSLTNIKIPDSVTSIGDNVFSNCTSLKDIKLSNKIGDIEINKWFGRQYEERSINDFIDIRVEWRGNYYYYKDTGK